MAYDAYFYLANGQQADSAPAFRLDEIDHSRLVKVLQQKPNSLPVLRRLEDYYRDAVIAGSEADLLRDELDVLRGLERNLAQSLDPLLKVVRTAGNQGMNLYFVSD